VPAAEKRKTPEGQPYGEAGKQEDFIEATSPVATPQVAQNEPQAAPVAQIAPQAFRPSEAAMGPVSDVLVPGRELEAEEAAALFQGGGEVSTEGLESLRDWWPAIAAIGGQRDAPPYFKVLAEAAERLMDEDEEDF